MHRGIWLAGLFFIGAIIDALGAPSSPAAEEFLTFEKKDFAAAVAQFSPQLKAALPENKLRQAWHLKSCPTSRLGSQNPAVWPVGPDVR